MVWGKMGGLGCGPAAEGAWDGGAWRKPGGMDLTWT